MSFLKSDVYNGMWPIRMQACEKWGFTEKAFKRDILNFSEADFDNVMWQIRLEAYKTLGFSEKSLKDEHWEIRQRARKILGIKK